MLDACCSSYFCIGRTRILIGLEMLFQKMCCIGTRERKGIKLCSVKMMIWFLGLSRDELGNQGCLVTSKQFTLLRIVKLLYQANTVVNKLGSTPCLTPPKGSGYSLLLTI